MNENAPDPKPDLIQSSHFKSHNPNLLTHKKKSQCEDITGIATTKNAIRRIDRDITSSCHTNQSKAVQYVKRFLMDGLKIVDIDDYFRPIDKSFFLVKLIQIIKRFFTDALETILDKSAFSDIISWTPKGTSWKILNMTIFEKIVIPNYFPPLQSYESFCQAATISGFQSVLSIEHGWFAHVTVTSQTQEHSGNRKRNDAISFKAQQKRQLLKKSKRKLNDLDPSLHLLDDCEVLRSQRAYMRNFSDERTGMEDASNYQNNAKGTRKVSFSRTCNSHISSNENEINMEKAHISISQKKRTSGKFDLRLQAREN